MIEADWMFVDTLTMAVEAAHMVPNDTEVDIRYTICFSPPRYLLDVSSRGRGIRHLGWSFRDEPRREAFCLLSPSADDAYREDQP